MAQRSSWRGLGLFWLCVLAVAGGGIATLQALGPPGINTVNELQAAPEPHAAPTAVAPSLASPAPRVSGFEEPTLASGIARPVAALLERSKAFPQLMLPRVADGRMARVIYAAPAPPVSGQPRIAILLSGFGQSARESGAAAENLPGAVSFAVSAYAGAITPLLDAAISRGHELFAAIPMEPQGYPLNDEGTRSLRTGLSPEENRTNLEWALGQTQGAVGATGASDGMRGERFAELGPAFDPILDEINRRGLLYIDPRPGHAPSRPGVAARSVDVVLDDPPARAEIEGKLASLERIAREKGSAIGLVGLPRPVTLDRIAAWAQGLQARGLVLVPVSSLVEIPK